MSGEIEMLEVIQLDLTYRIPVPNFDLIRCPKEYINATADQIGEMMRHKAWDQLTEKYQEYQNRKKGT